MNTKDNQRTRLTKRLLRESMIKLLKEHTIYEITVSQLCSEAEINRSTFYKYYSNVREIYEEIEREALEACSDCITKVGVHDEETIIKHIEELLMHIKQQSELYRLLLENSINGEFPYKLIEGTVGAVTSLYKPIPKNKKYAEYLSLFVVSGAVSVLRKWLNTGMNETPHELSKLILYIATEKTSAKQSDFFSAII